MGLGTKIKEVLHGDHRDHTTSDVKAPGAYPDEELSSRHSDGREYNSTHGSLANKRDTSDSAGKSDLGSVGIGNASAAGPGHDLASSSGSQRDQLHRNTDDYPAGTSQEDYSQPTHGHRPQDSGVGLGQQTSAKGHASEGASYWGDQSHEGHRDNTLAEDLSDRTSRGQDYRGIGKDDHSPHFADQAVGGGVYNSVTGAGSPEHSGSHGSPHISGGGVVPDPLTSSTKGTSVLPGSTYGQNVDQFDHGLPASRNDHTGAGQPGGNEYSHQGHGSSGYNPSHDTFFRDSYAPGVPRSNMLESEPGMPGPPTQRSRQGLGPIPRTQYSVGSTSTVSPGTITVGGLGKDHYGPAHEGAKVMHTCQHCGQDNDISQYFRKEAVYRLG